MALVYILGLLGLFRPKLEDSDKRSFTLRKAWELAHGQIIGKITIVLGLLNCITGVALLKPLLSGDNDFILWCALPIGWILLVIIADGIFDKWDDRGSYTCADPAENEKRTTQLSQL
jgi:hypothetical protein